VRRGVKVTVLGPGKIDHNIVRQASRAKFGGLLKAGIELYDYRAALLHSKTMVVDEVWATVGSTNLDNRSFALNEELNVAVYDEGIARRLARVFQDDLSVSTPVTYDSWKRRGLPTKLLELIVLPIRNQF
jgi:cardiolipin synthase